MFFKDLEVSDEFLLRNEQGKIIHGIKSNNNGGFYYAEENRISTTSVEAGVYKILDPIKVKTFKTVGDCKTRITPLSLPDVDDFDNMCGEIESTFGNY